MSRALMDQRSVMHPSWMSPVQLEPELRHSLESNLFAPQVMPMVTKLLRQLDSIAVRLRVSPLAVGAHQRAARRSA
jgi:hypothetical protein